MPNHNLRLFAAVVVADLFVRLAIPAVSGRGPSAPRPSRLGIQPSACPMCGQQGVLRRHQRPVTIGERVYVPWSEVEFFVQVHDQ
ncbi:hypothetical protein [Stenotrophomonas maltophilia]|uniref:hypothetical protein n=1 Tax=Stenotrophomonas maltophilia TaxID=40324 RepID=UPI0013D9A841|nr:hypothetical protein [Stenotrophomonas maltophilia]